MTATISDIVDELAPYNRFADPNENSISVKAGNAHKSINCGFLKAAAVFNQWIEESEKKVEGWKRPEDLPEELVTHEQISDVPEGEDREKLIIIRLLQLKKALPIKV